MTAMMTGGPPTRSGPGRPLPGGRDSRHGDEREARRLATRLAAAQRRLGLIEPTAPAVPMAVIEDLPEATGDTRIRAAFRRLDLLRRPRRTRP